MNPEHKPSATATINETPAERRKETRKETQERMLKEWQAWADGVIKRRVKLSDGMNEEAAANRHYMNGENPETVDTGIYIHDWSVNYLANRPFMTKEYADEKGRHALKEFAWTEEKRKGVEATLEKLSVLDENRKIYFSLGLEYPHSFDEEDLVLTTAGQAIRALRAHYAELLAGKTVPHSQSALCHDFMDAETADRRAAERSAAEKEVLSGYPDDQKLHWPFGGDDPEESEITVKYLKDIRAPHVDLSLAEPNEDRFKLGLTAALQELRNRLVDRISAQEKASMAPEARKQWMEWQAYARGRYNSSEETGDFTESESSVNKLNFHEPSFCILKYVERISAEQIEYVFAQADKADAYRETIQGIVDELAALGTGKEIFLRCGGTPTVRILAEQAEKSLRAHYADLLAGQRLPYETNDISFIEVATAEAQSQKYALERLRELDKYADDKRLVFAYGDGSHAWTTQAQELKAIYADYSYELYENETEQGGIAIVAEHGDLSAYEQTKHIADRLLRDRAYATLRRNAKLEDIARAKNQGCDVRLSVAGRAMLLNAEQAEAFVKNMQDEDLDDLAVILELT